ncbi:MAG: molecular chaperone HtpG [Lachnospiraceae bacterium]|nr:molecular chaperone HtpG [Lachnospiraceae bacterium]
MARKQFKTESKKLLDMMINSIYTHKEVFLRELISNASDACDKLHFRSLTDDRVKLNRDDYEIRIEADKEGRTITISDNGCGMTAEELEKNLGTIAKSGSYEFKQEHPDSDEIFRDEKAEDAEKTEAGADGAQEEAAADADEKGDAEAARTPQVDVIGQFGVGFYSAFMVSDCITVVSRAYDEQQGTVWQSRGVEGYTIDPCEKESNGTTITLHLKADTPDENYSEFLDEWKIRELVKKYSDYIHYPIRMMVTRSRKKEGTPDDKPEYEEYKEDETLNSMIPIWKKATSEVTDEEYAQFYESKFYDYEAPLKVIRQKSEGTSEFVALLFIPSRAPYNYYSREYEKGLQLYSSGVLIMDKCKDLLPDYFSFVRGLVDSSDLSLNLSREFLQHDRQLRVIARAVEKKIGAELKKMQADDREKYEKFFDAFGTQLKYGLYTDFGSHKEALQDLVMWKSSHEEKPVTLKEYVSRMKEDQKSIYYVPGESIDAMKRLPQVEAVLAKGFEVLYLTEDVDEFAIKMLREYDGKTFLNVTQDELDLATDEEKEAAKTENESSADLLKFMQESVGSELKSVRFTNTLTGHPACLASEGELSVNMEKTLNKMPGSEADAPKAELVLEINLKHPIADRLKALYGKDDDTLAKYTRILYAQARLISGLSVGNAAEIGDLVCQLML